jgi:hypothetical protein
LDLANALLNLFSANGADGDFLNLLLAGLRFSDWHRFELQSATEAAPLFRTGVRFDRPVAIWTLGSLPRNKSAALGADPLALSGRHHRASIQRRTEYAKVIQSTKSTRARFSVSGSNTALLQQTLIN